MKLLIIDCNAKIGGIQKSLVALLNEIGDKYDITLMLFNKNGPLLEQIPDSVKVLETKSDYRYMGMAQADCKSLCDKIKRGIYVLLCRIFKQKNVYTLLSKTIKKDEIGEYDLVISYSHLANEKVFYGGVADYICRKFKQSKKICFIHCDYINSGNRSIYSDYIYSLFDGLVCVSRSTQEKFLQALPELKSRTYMLRNLIDEEHIKKQANQNPVIYNHKLVTFVSVARLTREKGIERMIDILSKISTKYLEYYVVGDGSDRAKIERKIQEYNLNNVVHLVGEDENPYRHMKNADIILVPSYNEAAPIIYQEAKLLGIPVLTTNTLSADEMIGSKYGLVVENSDDAIKNAINSILEKTCEIRKNNCENTAEFQVSSFSDLMSNILK